MPTTDELIASFQKRIRPYEVTTEEREQVMTEGEVGQYPGDQPDQFLQSGRKEFNTLKTDRLALTDQVKRAREEQARLHPHPRLERMFDAVTGSVPSFLSPDVPTPEAVLQTQPSPKPSPLKGRPAQGTPEYLAEHEARRVPTGDWQELDKQSGGQFGKGNIDLNNRSIQVHKNGKDYSSLESMSFEENGQEVLIPTVVNGKLLSDDAAIAHYRKTGQHLGKFASPEEASAYALQLERRQQAYYEKGPGRAILDKTLKPPQPKQYTLTGQLPDISSISPKDQKPLVFTDKAGKVTRTVEPKTPKPRPSSLDKLAESAFQEGRNIGQEYANEEAYPVEIEVPEVVVTGERITPKEEYKPASIQEALTNAVNNYFQGAAGVASGALKSVALASRELDRILPDAVKDPRKAEDRFTYKLGTSIENMAKRLFPSDPASQQDFIVGVLPQALGSMTGFIAGGLAGTLAKAPGTAAAVLGAGVQGSEQYEDAKHFKANDETQRKSFLLGSAVGTTQGLPIAGIFKRFNTATGGAFFRTLKESGVTAAQEFVQEWSEQVGSNAIAKELYDENRGLFDNAGISGSAGGATGAIVGLISGLIQGRRIRRSMRNQEQANDSQFSGEPEPAPSVPPQPPPQPSVPTPQDIIAGIPNELNVAQGEPFLVKQPRPEPVVPSQPEPMAQAPTEPMTTQAPSPMPLLPAPPVEPMPAVPAQPERALAPEPEAAPPPVMPGDIITPDMREALDTPIDVDVHEAATSPVNHLPEPTEAMKKAGNYKKGHTRISGLDISIENPQGSIRSGTDRDGNPWSQEMQSHYGYIRGTKGKDKDHIDVFIKPGTPKSYSGDVYIIDQNKPGTKTFDEHKVILGASSQEEATQLYLENYASGWTGLGAINKQPMHGFKQWLKSGETTKPFNRQENVQREQAAQSPAGELVQAKNGKWQIRRPDGTFLVNPSNGTTEFKSAKKAQELYDKTIDVEVEPYVDDITIKKPTDSKNEKPLYITDREKLLFKSPNPGEKETFEQLNIDDLKINDDDHPRKFKPSKAKALRTVINDKPDTLPPISVQRRSDGDYVTDGRHRLEAAKLEGYTTITAQVHEDMRGKKKEGIPTPQEVFTAPQVQQPRSELPIEQNMDMMLRAEKAEADLEIAGKETGRRKVFDYEVQGQGGTPEVTGLRSAAPAWYTELTTGPRPLKRAQIDTAIQKIIKDEGSDVGTAVERVKEALLRDREFNKTPWGEDADAIARGEWPSWIEKPGVQTPEQVAKREEPPTPELVLTAPQAQTVDRKRINGKAKPTQMSIDVPPPTVGERPIIGREVTTEEAPLFSKAAQTPAPEQTTLTEPNEAAPKEVAQKEKRPIEAVPTTGKTERPDPVKFDAIDFGLKSIREGGQVPPGEPVISKTKNGTKTLSINGELLSVANVKVYDDEVRITKIETLPYAQHKGFATALVDDLMREFPGRRLGTSLKTDQGRKFFTQYEESKAKPRSAPKPAKPSAYALDTIDRMYRKILDDTKVVHHMRRGNKEAWATVKRIDAAMKQGQSSGLDYDEAAAKVSLDDLDALNTILEEQSAKPTEKIEELGAPDRTAREPYSKTIRPSDQRIQERVTSDYDSFQSWQDDTMATPGRLIKKSARFANQSFFKGDPQNFSIQVARVSDLVPTQTGEDYINDSSKELARKTKAIIRGKEDVSRLEDYEPIVVDQDGKILDGNHRHAAATINNESHILVMAPVGSGDGSIVNLQEFYRTLKNRGAAIPMFGLQQPKNQKFSETTPSKELADLFKQESDHYRKKKSPSRPRIPVSPITGGTVTPLSRIILDLSKGLGQKVTVGKPGRGAGGVYRPGSTATIIKYSGDLDATAHELAGHFIDDKIGIVSEWKGKDTSPFDPELEPFWEHGSVSETTSPTYNRAEGVAEYLRAWLVNPDAAEAAAPTFAKHVKTKLPSDIQKALKTFSDQVRSWAGNSAHAKIMANVQWETPETGLTDWLTKRKTSQGPGFQLTFGDQLAIEWTDTLAPFTKALKYVRDQRGGQTTEQAQHYEGYIEDLARLYMGENAKIDDVFAHGMIDSKMDRATPGGLSWLIEPLDSTSSKTLEADMQEVASLMIAERTLEKAEQLGKSRVSGIGAGIEADMTVAEARLAELKKNPERYAKLKDAASRYRQWADANLRYLVEKGRLSQEQYEDIKARNEYYVAMQRMIEVSPGEEIVTAVPRGTGAGKIGSVKQPVQTFKGSTKAIKNPYHNLMDATNSTLREADRNEIMKLFRDMLTNDRGLYEGQPTDLASVGRTAQAGEKHTIPIYVNGKKEIWQFHPDVYAALKDMQGDHFKFHPLIRVLPQILRSTIVNAPPFALRNLIRDSWHRAIVSLSGSKPWDTLKPYSKEEISKLKRSGGDQAGHYYSDPKSYARAMTYAMQEAVNSNRSIVVSPSKLAAWVAKGGRGYLDLMQQSERQGRLSEYRRSFEKAKKKLGYDDYHASIYAAAQSRSLIDYAIAGRQMRWINQVVPFSNAAVQGMRANLLRAKADPTGYAMRFGAFALIPTLATYLWNYAFDDDMDEYRQLPAYQRDLFWNFKLGPDLWLKIPKPFENGVAASSFERGLDYAIGNDKAFDGHVGAFLRTLLPIDEASFMGPFQAFGQAMANYDFFRDRHIVPQWEENVDLELRSYNRASRLGQALQHAIGVDARKIDFMINQQFGYLGRYAADISDIGRKDRHGLTISASGVTGASPSSVSIDAKKVVEIAESRGVVAGRSKALDKIKDIRAIRPGISKDLDSARYAIFKRHLNEVYKAESREERDRLAAIVRSDAKYLRELWEKKPPRQEATEKAKKKREEVKDPLLEAMGFFSDSSVPVLDEVMP